MAVLKHNASKNANYGHAIDYLTKQYDEHINKPILDEFGCLKEREEYRIAYFNSSGEKGEIENWEKDCITTNLKYKKNLKEDEIKSHQYILAFEDEDNLSIDEVQALAEEYAMKYFKGHQILIASHPGHAHIIINSCRDRAIEKEDWMEKYKNGDTCRWEYEAGMKHHVSAAYMVRLKKETMEFCKGKGLKQIDLLGKAEEKKTDKEYYAEKKAEKKKKITYKEYVRQVIEQGKSKCKSPKEFYDFLKENNVETRRRGTNITYKTKEGQKWIRESSLGTDYMIDNILKAINENNKEEAEHKLQGTYIENILKILDLAKETCRNPEEFNELLKKNNLECVKRGQYVRYKFKKGKKWIREKSLGDEYTTEAILRAINENNKRMEIETKQQELLDLKMAIEKAKESGLFGLPKHTNKEGIPYQISMYNKDGQKRTVLESVLLLATVMVTGEVPEFALPQWQQNKILRQKNKEAVELANAKKKIRELNEAVNIAESMDIRTVEALNRKIKKNKQLSPEQIRKLKKLRRVVYKALDPDYCSNSYKEHDESLSAKVENVGNKRPLIREKQRNKEKEDISI